MYKITSKFLRVPKWRKVILLLTVLCTLNGFSQTVEYITNGDIETTGGWRILQYSNVAPSGTSQPKQYAVVTNAQQFNGAFVNTTSRTGSGNFL